MRSCASPTLIIGAEAVAAAHKLGLGTAQFGFAYGIANAARTPRAEVAAALAYAQEAGVRVLDTAPGYGEAEALIGQLCPGGGGFRIVSKTAPNARTPADLRDAFSRTLDSLRAAKLYALLEHRPAQLLGERGQERFDVLLGLRAEGLVERVGASVYSRAEIDALLERFPIELIQLPLSLLDQRLIRDGTLARLRARGVEVHARSVLLQGALALAPAALPAFLASARESFERAHAEARSRGRSAVALAVAFAASLAEVEVAIVGAATRAQLAELIEAASLSVDPAELASLALADQNVLDPSRWPVAS